MKTVEEKALKRDIGFFGSAFLSFNGVVGAGIFALPGTLYEKFGAFSPFLFPLFGLLVLLVALPFARAAGHHRLSGGPVVYAAAFGPVASFQAGWLYYVAPIGGAGGEYHVLVTYLAVLAGAWRGFPRAA
jgi:amino acid transporter